jgi:NAD(P)H-dependent FMN reductase
MRPRVVAVVGSLQARSSNKALVEAFGGLLSGATQFVSSGALHVLPPFNSDFESDNVPETVMAWRAELAAADAVVFATPEYAFGIAGALKNSLDWVVGSGELVAKPVVLMGASTMATGASLALEALERTLRVMSAEVVGVLSVPHVRAKLDANGRVTDDATAAGLMDLAEKLAARLMR